jgi:putative MATE family efflux protein
MNIQLSDHFNYRRLLRFTLPSMIMMIFTSVYSMVDGLFISNFVGITPFAAINLIFPFIMLLSALGFMFGTGGSALVSALLGARQPQKANRIFSMLTYLAILVGAVIAALGIAFLRPISQWMGAEGEMLAHCITYGRILLLALPGFMLQNLFQSFLVTAQKPTLGLAVTVVAGLTNIVLDWLFIVVFRWGVVGAAAATAIAQCVGGVIPLAYFSVPNSSLLHLGRASFDGAALLQTCTNGLSELVTNLSMSLVSILYNFQLMRLAGEHGVAANGAVMYISFAFVAVFLGYSIGAAPVVGFHYGAQNHGELKNLFGKSNVIVLTASALLAATAFALSKPLALLFVPEDAQLLDMTVDAFRFYAVSVLFSGFSIFGSAFFTALGNGTVSATISFLRTFLFQVMSVLILPVFWGVDGIWYSLFVAEMLAMAVTALFYHTNRKKYHYA